MISPGAVIFLLFQQNQNKEKMKKIILITIVSTLLFAGCQPKEQPQTVDLKAIKDTVNILAEKYMKAVIARDIEVLSGLIAEDGLYCGTDPSEIFDRQALLDYWTEISKDTVIDYSYKVGLREIKLADDGKSAIILEHIKAPGLSPNMPVVQSYQLVKKDNKWQIDFISWGFLIRNEDVAKVNEELMPQTVVE